MLAVVSETSGAADMPHGTSTPEELEDRAAKPSLGSSMRKALCFQTIGTREAASLIGLRTVKMKILREFQEGWEAGYN